MFILQSKMKAIDVDLPFYVRLQRLFYIIPPNESMFEHLDDVPNYVGEVSAPVICSVVSQACTCTPWLIVERVTF